MSLNRSFLLALTFVIFVTAVFLTVAQPAQASSSICGLPSVANLVTADGTVVGNAYIWNSDNQLHVRFQPNEGYRIMAIDYEPVRYRALLPAYADGTLNPRAFSVRRTYSIPMVAATFNTALNPKWELGADLHIGGHLLIAAVDENGAVIEQMEVWADGKTESEQHQYFKHIIQPCQ